MDSELDWDGSPWPPLSEGYAAWKSEHYPGKLMAELDMIMKTPEQMIGTISITGVAMHQLYGTTEEAQQHSVWFQEGDQAGRQPPRPFYALNPQAIADLDDVLDHWFVDHLP
jgi:phage gpG-like protein